VLKKSSVFARQPHKIWERPAKYEAGATEYQPGQLTYDPYAFIVFPIKTIPAGLTGAARIGGGGAHIGPIRPPPPLRCPAARRRHSAAVNFCIRRNNGSIPSDSTFGTENHFSISFGKRDKWPGIFRRLEKKDDQEMGK